MRHGVKAFCRGTSVARLLDSGMTDHQIVKTPTKDLHGPDRIISLISLQIEERAGNDS